MKVAKLCGHSCPSQSNDRPLHLRCLLGHLTDVEVDLSAES
jgi:hypothetical protein